MLIAGAASISLAFVVLFWGMAGAKTAPNVLARSLMTGRSVFTDARQALLATNAHDRAVVPMLEGLARRARRLTPTGMVESLERRMVLAGISPRWTVERLLAIKLVLAATSGVFGALRFVGDPRTLNLLIACGSTVSSYFSVDLMLYNKSIKRQEKISIALADTIDQITVSVEAGLGLESAIARAAKTGEGPLAEELLRTLQDIQAGMPRTAALKSLAERTTDTDLRRFVSAIVQAEAYGVPVGQVLRVQAGELRVKRRQRAEEQAMKLPVKVLFPLVTCILPAMFIVLLGPAAIRITRTL